VSDTLKRQWTILQLIPSYPRSISIKDIIDKLENSLVDVPNYRTIQRDLDTLSQIFPLSSSRKDKAFYWSIRLEEGVLEIPKMGSPTALAFYLAEKSLQDQLPPVALDHLQAHFKTANKLLTNQQSGYLEWTEKIRVLPQTQQLIPPKPNADVLNTIYTALLDNKRFEGQYFGRRDDQHKTYLVNPIALVLRGSVTYLACTLRAYTDVRVLSLHRFVDAKIQDIDRWVPAGFLLDEYIEEGHFDFLMGNEIDLELKIDEEVAIHLRESKLTENQKIMTQSDGTSVFKAQIKDTGQLRWWLLGFADQIEIVKPIALRQEFAEKTQAMANKYKTTV